MQSTLRPIQIIPRQICKYWPDYHSGKFEKLWVFGPSYREKELDFRHNAKKEALNFVLEKSGCTLPKVLSALQNIEEEATATYTDDTVKNLPRVEFREMMAVDGCFFLLLAFSMLGVGSIGAGLRFPEKHLIFGIGCFREDMDLWLNSMFFVGNQIPLIVLEEIMKLRFFQGLKIEMQWTKPLEVAKRALYNFLIVEHLPKPVDIIHCLQLLILGRKSGTHIGVTLMEPDAGDAIEEIPSAGELSKLGIKFEKLEGDFGSRGIHYKCSAFKAVLYLPVFKVDENTEMIIKYLCNYEIVQASRGIEPEAISYFTVLSELIRTQEDIEILSSQGIIQGQLEGFPGILSSFNGMVLSDYMSHVRREIRDNPPQYWHKCIKLIPKLIALFAAIVIFIFSFQQAFYSLLLQMPIEWGISLSIFDVI